MARRLFHKLVRDRIPDIIARNGGVPLVHTLDDADFALALKQKLVEEAQELRAAQQREEILDGLTDVLHVSEALAHFHGFSAQEIEASKAKKLQERGGFDKRVYLEHVDDAA